jgi:mevalonate kinase
MKALFAKGDGKGLIRGISALRRDGALGAKLTGGGAGGAVVAVAEDAAAVRRVLAASGTQAMMVTLSA